MEYRLATDRDLDLLAEWNHQLIRDEGHRNRMTVPELRVRMQGWLAGEYAAVLFHVGTAPVAYALYRETDDEVYLRHFFVVRERRRQGLGREALGILRERIWPPTKRLTVEALTANQQGVSFWRAVSFQDYALTLEIMPREPHGTAVDDSRTLAADVILRPYRVDDVSPLLEAARESVTEVEPFLPWCRPNLTAEEQLAWIEAQAAARAAGRAFEFVVLSGDGAFLGGCGVNQIDALNRRANVGYWVRSSATRRGVATAALRQAVRWAFQHTDLVRLEVLVSTRNAASLRVADKAGAVREGVLRRRLLLHGTWHDAVLFSIVRGSETRLTSG